MNDLLIRAPHRPAASADSHSPHAALLIDFDNVTMGIRSNLGQELRKLLDSDMIRGKVSVQRAYADWRRYPQYIASLSEASIDLIFAPAYGSTKKNATDIRLAIDALEIVFIRPEIGTFILLSGDSDFSSLVLKLKEYGKYVIGVGIQESSSDLLVQNCDEYYSYNSLSGLTSASDMQNIEKHDPWELAAKAIRRMTERGDVMRSDRFKQVMLELDPSFDEKSIGFSKFNRFLTESASRGILELQKAANGQYEVAAGPRIGDFGDGSSAASPSPGSIGRGSRAEAEDSGSRRRERTGGSRSSRSEGRSSRRGRSRGGRQPEPAPETPPAVDEDRLREAYDLLRSVVAEKATRGAVRDSEVKRQMVERDPAFDEATLGFRKFSRFLRQAHDEEVINLERTDEGNYEISPVNGASSAPLNDAAAGGESDGTSGAATRRGGRRERSGRRGRGSRGSRSDQEDRERDEAQASRDEESVAGEPAEEPVEEPVTAAASAHDPPPTPLMGRKRRSQASAAGRGSGVVPGPVDGEKEPKREKQSPTTEQAASGSSRRTMGRFRRGSRGKAAPGDRAPEPKSAAPAAESDSGLTPPQEDLVDRMARGYQGVGRRTAERLVEEFGDRVLDVIDNEPGRIEEVLPSGRARAVIDGRQAELEASAD